MQYEKDRRELIELLYKYRENKERYYRLLEENAALRELAPLAFTANSALDKALGLAVYIKNNCAKKEYYGNNKKTKKELLELCAQVKKLVKERDSRRQKAFREEGKRKLKELRKTKKPGKERFREAWKIKKEYGLRPHFRKTPTKMLP
jgi:BioD-like phosphotransacetylase family protein